MNVATTNSAPRRRSARRDAQFSQRLSRYAAGVATLAGSAGLAHADFSGPYTLTQPTPPAGSYTLSGNQTFGAWSSNASGPGLTLDDSFAPASLLLSRSTVNSNTTGENLSVPAFTAGNLSFSYATSGTPSAAYTVGGNTFPLSGSGTISNVALTTGQIFGFSLNSFYSSAAGTLTISNFTAPIPEPGAGTWLAAGAVGLLAARAARRRTAKASAGASACD